METSQPQPQSRGLYVQPAAPPKKPGTGRRVLRWVLVLVLAFACLASVFLNFVGFSMLSGSSRRGDGIVETHVSGPTSFAAAAKVAIVSVDGVILGDETGGSASWVVQQLKRARDDGKVRGVILHVSSPGGGVTASDIIYNRVLELQAPPHNKKVVVLMGDIAASGGYYISAPADEILAHPTTITGSIGVIISSFNIEKLLEKIGVSAVVFKSQDTPHKDILSLYRPLSPDERAILQGITESMYGRFRQIVAKGRKMSDDEVALVATGAIFTAEQARDLKLVDAIGYQEDAEAAARRLVATQRSIGPAEIAVVKYEKPPSLLGTLLAARSDPAAEIQAQLKSLVDSRQSGFYYLWPGP